MNRAAVEYARRVGKALAQRPSAVALRKAVWKEMEPLRRSFERYAEKSPDETENQVENA